MSEIGRLFIIIGLFFDFIGVISLLRMPDVYSRLQAASKGVVFGTICIFTGVFLYSGVSGLGFKALLLIGFLMLTAPVSIHALMRGIYKNGIISDVKFGCDQLKIKE